MPPTQEPPPEHDDAAETVQRAIWQHVREIDGQIILLLRHLEKWSAERTDERFGKVTESAEVLRMAATALLDACDTYAAAGAPPAPQEQENMP